MASLYHRKLMEMAKRIMFKHSNKDPAFLQRIMMKAGIPAQQARKAVKYAMRDMIKQPSGIWLLLVGFVLLIGFVAVLFINPDWIVGLQGWIYGAMLIGFVLTVIGVLRHASFRAKMKGFGKFGKANKNAAGQ